jgi:hypothetical protein
MARDECGLDGSLTYTNGTPTFVDVTATGEVRAGPGRGPLDMYLNPHAMRSALAR